MRSQAQRLSSAADTSPMMPNAIRRWPDPSASRSVRSLCLVWSPRRGPCCCAGDGGRERDRQKRTHARLQRDLSSSMRSASCGGKHMPATTLPDCWTAILDAVIIPARAALPPCRGAHAGSPRPRGPARRGRAHALSATGGGDGRGGVAGSPVLPECRRLRCQKCRPVVP